jgi:tRNA dimethylallyltransferase
LENRDMLPEHLPNLALAGPTASGKTAGALALAAVLGTALAAGDHQHRLGAGVPGHGHWHRQTHGAELAEVPHHLIDIRDPDQPYSAAEFAADATRLMADIQSRGKHPLLVGGTMLYLKALLHPMDDMPPAQPELRAQLEAEAYEQGWPALHAQLALVDPTTAARLSPNDSQRVGRALEVYRATGKPLSSFHTGGAAAGKPAAHAMPVISLEPTDRTWLHKRIAQRFDAMLAQGLVDEVRHLMALPHFHPDLPSMRCVGYRQAWEELDYQARKGPDAPLNIAHFRERGIVATRQLAKRQVTWLRSMPERHAIACDHPTAVAELVQAVLLRLDQAERSAAATLTCHPCPPTARSPFRTWASTTAARPCSPRSTSPCSPASLWPSWATRAWANPRCSTAWRGWTSGTKATSLTPPPMAPPPGWPIWTTPPAPCGAAPMWGLCSRPFTCCRTWTWRRTWPCR